MAQSYVLNTVPLFRTLICVVQVFLLHEVINWVGWFYGYLARSTNEEFDNVKKNNVEEKDKHGFELMGDNPMELAMGRLGIFLDPKGEKIGFGDDLTNIFEEKEPSLEEVKGAFDVFDENKDGFVDEVELQRVLINLGLKEGLDVQNCKIMISRYDENGDGRIDFKEFVKMIEKTFC